jgi:hypothetical protein
VTERQVIINGKTFLYRQKAPFVPSGMSVCGALEFDEAEDRVKCHECGEWFRHVGLHAVAAHRITAKEYKRRHGLRAKSALCGESIRTRLSAGMAGRGAAQAMLLNRPNTRWMESVLRRMTGDSNPGKLGRTGEDLNKRMHCRAQLMQRIKTVAEKLGRTPTCLDLAEHGMHYNSIASSFNVKTINEVMRIIGLSTNSEFPRKKYTRESLIGMLRDFFNEHRRIPTRSDQNRGIFPAFACFRRYFSSMDAVYVEAGLSEVARTQLSEARRRAQAASTVARYYSPSAAGVSL